MKVMEMRDCDRVTKGLYRAVLFLRTDLEYLWRDYNLIGDSTLGPFQALAFLIALPLTFLGMLHLEAAPSYAQGLLAFLIILALTCATLVGGGGLRSLFTGIDHRVWRSIGGSTTDAHGPTR